MPRGGRREGAGRKREDGRKTRLVAVRVTDEEHARLLATTTTTSRRELWLAALERETCENL